MRRKERVSSKSKVSTFQLPHTDCRPLGWNTPCCLLPTHTHSVYTHTTCTHSGHVIRHTCAICSHQLSLIYASRHYLCVCTHTHTHRGHPICTHALCLHTIGMPSTHAYTVRIQVCAHTYTSSLHTCCLCPEVTPLGPQHLEERVRGHIAMGKGGA